MSDDSFIWNAPWTCSYCGTVVKGGLYHDCKRGTLVNPPPVPHALDVLRAERDAAETALSAERTRRERAEAEARAAFALLDYLDQNWGPGEREDELRAAWLATRTPTEPTS